MSRRHLGIFTAAVLAAASLTACGGSGDDSAASPKTLTYWASNQGASLEADKTDPPAGAGQVREADRHQGQPSRSSPGRTCSTASWPPPPPARARTWSTSATPGRRRCRPPARWSPFDDAALQADRRQGPVRARRARRRRRPRQAAGRRAALLAWRTACTTTRRCSPTPASPRRRPPGSELADVRQEADQRRQVGPGDRGRQPVGERPPRLHLQPAVRRRVVRRRPASRPSTPRQNVAAIKRYVDFMAADKITNPSNAEYAQNQSLSDFANGKAAMLLWQAAGSNLKTQGMNADAYGRRPGAVPGQPAGRRQEGQQHGRRDQHGGLQAHQEPGRRAEVREVHDQRRRADDPQQGVRLDAAGEDAAQADPAFSATEQKVLAGDPGHQRRRRCRRSPTRASSRPWSAPR